MCDERESKLQFEVRCDGPRCSTRIHARAHIAADCGNVTGSLQGQYDPMWFTGYQIVDVQ